MASHKLHVIMFHDFFFRFSFYFPFTNAASNDHGRWSFWLFQGYTWV